MPLRRRPSPTKWQASESMRGVGSAELDGSMDPASASSTPRAASNEAEARGAGCEGEEEVL